MYTFLLILQYIGVFVILAELIYIFRQRPSKAQSLLLACSICVILNSAGYLFEMQALTKEQAITAVQFLYLGKAFAPFTMFLFIMDYCKIKISRIVTGILLSVHCFILLLVLSCQHNTLFYNNIDFTKEGLFPHLILGHGIIYILYTSMIVAYLIIISITCVRRYFLTKTTVEHKQIFYLICSNITMGIGLLLFLNGMTRGYDTTAIAYIVSASLLLPAMVKHNLFDTLSFAKDYVIDNLAEGLVIIDTSDKVLYVNEVAKALYPEFNNGKASAALEDLHKRSNEQSNIFINDTVYRVSKKEIMNQHILLGSLYTLDDITGSYNYTKRLKEDVDTKTQEIIKLQHSVIASFANIVEARDGITGQHVKRTSAYVEIITKALQKNSKYKDLLNNQATELIIDAAPLHDIGKIGIPDSILTKPGRLTEEEFKIIQSHCETGSQIIAETLASVEDSKYLTIAQEMAHYHHEKWDGSGYPCGLRGEEIPLCARIMAIADVYDALCSKRSYKDAFSKEHALEIILENAGKHFDPDIVAVFQENIDLIEAI